MDWCVGMNAVAEKLTRTLTTSRPYVEGTTATSIKPTRRSHAYDAERTRRIRRALPATDNLFTPFFERHDCRFLSKIWNKRRVSGAAIFRPV